MTKLLQTRSEKRVTDMSSQEIEMIKEDISLVLKDVKSLGAKEARLKLVSLRFGVRKNTLLHLAAKFDHFKAAQEIIQISQGESQIINAQNYNYFTPMHFAGICGGLKIANLLIKVGADKNAKASEQKRKWHPIHYAAKYGNLKVLKLFLESGVDIESRTAFGLTPFITAAEFGQFKAIDFLLKNGANKDAQTFNDNSNMTALHYAVIDGNFEVTDYLLKAGVKRDCKTGFDLSALDFAARTNNIKIAILLMSWGAGSLSSALEMAKASKSSRATRVIEKYISDREEIFSKKWLAENSFKLASALKEFKLGNLTEARFSSSDGIYFNAYGILLLRKNTGLFQKKYAALRDFCLKNNFTNVADELKRVNNLAFSERSKVPFSELRQ